MEPANTTFDAPSSVPTPGANEGPSARALLFELTVTFSLIALFSWLGIKLSGHSEGVATIWFSNGLLFAIVIRRSRAVWPWFFLAGIVGEIVGDMIYGQGFILVLGVSLINSMEVILAAVLLSRWFGHPFELSYLKPLVGFLVVAVAVAPLGCSILRTLWVALLGGPDPWWQAVRTWYLGDCLGMAIVAPLVYILQRPGFFAVLRPRKIFRTVLMLAIPSIVALLVFNHSADPMVFALFPALLIVVFRLGFPGAVLSIVLVAFISISLTVSGHGSLTLIPSANVLHRIMVVQIFLAIALFSCFPVAALLEQRAWLEASLQKSEKRFRELANTDALTGQGNRRAFDHMLAIQWQQAQKAGEHLALLSIDVDRFKTYNDVYGHLAGDACLLKIATTLAETLLCYHSAKLFRLGGEEFVAILPGADSETGFSIAELIRKAVLSATIEHSGSPLGRQSVSIGVASTTPQLDVLVLSLLNRSDQALYGAKHNGRNRTEIAGSEPVFQQEPTPHLALL